MLVECCNCPQEDEFYRDLINLYRNPARLYWETKREKGVPKFGGDPWDNVGGRQSKAKRE